MASFAQLKGEVIFRLGNRTDLDARLPTWLNDAYYELLLSPRFSFYELEKQATTATIDSLRAYDLPPDCWFILDIRDDTNGRKLRRSHWSNFDKTSPTTGEPMRYSRFGGTVELDPTPDDVYNLIIRYRMRPTELSDIQAPVTGREWDEVIVLMTVIKGLEALEQQDRAAMQRQLLEAVISARLDVPQLEDMDAETTIGVRFE